MWYVLACLFGRNPLIGNPALPYIGIVLLAHAFSRAGLMRRQACTAVWVLMALGYSLSGYTKLTSPSWIDGSALVHILNNPLARPGVMRDALLALPSVYLRAATWGTLGLELLFAPLALSRPLRPWLWGAMLTLHLGLIGLIDFADLSLGMVMLHLFTYDVIRDGGKLRPDWVVPYGDRGPANQAGHGGRSGGACTDRRAPALEPVRVFGFPGDQNSPACV
jgi:hypothetical protein